MWWKDVPHVKKRSIQTERCGGRTAPRKKKKCSTKDLLTGGFFVYGLNRRQDRDYFVEIKKLEEVFYIENTHLVEVMDKRGNAWNSDKTRGYGVVVVEIVGLRFGIPLRSHANHKQCYNFSGDKALDYSKAVLLMKDEYISEVPFKIPDEEFIVIQKKSFFITQQFTKYVERYIEAVKKSDENKLKPYRFSTLQNYHAELKI